MITLANCELFGKNSILLRSVTHSKKAMISHLDMMRLQD